MSILIRRILIVNSLCKEIGIELMNKFADQLGKLCDNLENVRISLLNHSRNLEKGYIQIAYEAEISDLQIFSSLVLKADAEDWYSEWLKEADKISFYGWIEIGRAHV